MTAKSAAAVELGRKGGKARARNMTAEQRKQAARKAIEARWAKQRELIKDVAERTKALLKTAEVNARRAKRAPAK